MVNSEQAEREKRPCGKIVDISRRSFMVTSAAFGVSSLALLAGCSSSEKPATEKDQQALNTAEPNSEPKPTTAEKVYIVDTFSPKPGDGKAFLDDYMKIYRPIAENAGITLVSTTIAPPMWLDSDTNSIQIVWAMDDIAVSAWAMSSATRYLPEYVEWFESVRKRVLARDRSYFASEEYMEVLNNV